jgi:hypothetical protein
MQTFPQAAQARGNIRRTGIFAIAAGVIFVVAGAFGSLNRMCLGPAGLFFGALFIFLGIQWLRSRALLTVDDTGLSVAGNRLGGENWSLPWSSIDHAQAATAMIGGKPRRVLYLYPPGEAPKPLRGILEGQFDNFDEIVKAVGGQLANAGRPLEESVQT